MEESFPSNELHLGKVLRLLWLIALRLYSVARCNFTVSWDMKNAQVCPAVINRWIIYILETLTREHLFTAYTDKSLQHVFCFIRLWIVKRLSQYSTPYFHCVADNPPVISMVKKALLKSTTIGYLIWVFGFPVTVCCPTIPTKIIEK